MKRIFLLLIVILSLANHSFSQEYSVKTKKAILHFEDALNFYRNHQYQNSIVSAEKALEKDSAFIEVYYLLADIYGIQIQYEKKIDALQKAINIDPQNNARPYIMLIQTQLHIGQYREAKKNLNIVKRLESGRMFTSYIDKYSVQCDFAINAIENPVEFTPVNLGNKINTKYDEYLPSLSADGQTLIYTVSLPRPGVTEILSQADTQEDFFIAMSDENGNRLQAKNMGPPVNTPANEGAQSVSPDGRMLFFTSCNNTQGTNLHGESYGSCDIFVSFKTADKWSKPQNVGRPVNSYWWDSQPCFSSDGKTLFFVSDRPGGHGGIDIWYAKLRDDGSWSEVKNAGKNINTIGDEQSPFMHPDNQTLYFSSNGHLGMGGSDLFISRRDSTGSFQKAQNLGWPINTHKEEFSLIVNAKGDKAYFAASYEQGMGGMDLYEFEMPVNNRPLPVTFVKGTVFDAISGKKLYSAFNIFELEKGDTVTSAFSDKNTGEFLICMPTGKEFALNVSKPGYLFYSQHFSLPPHSDSIKTYNIEIPLSPIIKGEKTILKNVFFDVDSYILKHESNAELDKAVNFIKNNPNITVEIGGHTDNTGSEPHNLKLSENRAKAVYQYFISKEVSPQSLTYKGFGSKIPISDNNTPQGRQDNRRTEIKIIDVR